MGLVKKTEDFQLGQATYQEFKGNDRNLPSPLETKVVAQSVWEKKDRSMLIGGLAHDAATIVNALILAHGLKAEQAIAEFEKVLTGVLAIREKLEK